MNTREIFPDQIWDKNKMEKIDAFIKEHKENQSDQKRIKSALLSVRYQIEDYINSDILSSENHIQILDFVKMYLQVFGITKKELANYFKMKDSNLHKYLTGKRKLNPELVLKLSAFTDTNPEYWYRIQVKNELKSLKNEDREEYKKYEYKSLLGI